MDLYGPRSNRKEGDVLTGTVGLDTPVMMIPPGGEGQQQTFLQSPVPMRVGNLGEKASSGS